MSQDRQEAARCFSAEAGACDEWAGDGRKRGTGLLAKGLGSCWKKASCPAESPALRYPSFLFAFLPLPATTKVGIGSPCPEVGINQMEKSLPGCSTDSACNNTSRVEEQLESTRTRSGLSPSSHMPSHEHNHGDQAGASGHRGPSCGKWHHEWALVWVWDCLGTENVPRLASATGALASQVNYVVISDHLFAKRGSSLRAWSSLHRWPCKSCGTVFARCPHHNFILAQKSSHYTVFEKQIKHSFSSSTWLEGPPSSSGDWLSVNSSITGSRVFITSVMLQTSEQKWKTQLCALAPWLV